MDNEEEKGQAIEIPDPAELKKCIWDEYLQNLNSLRAQYPDDFTDMPLEPIMPDDIIEILKLRNKLYRYLDDPLYVNIHSSE